MSSVPTATGVFSICVINLPSLAARGTPLLLIPTSVRFSTPLFFSTISWARRIRVRSISEADMMRPFSRRFGRRVVEPAVIVLRMISDAGAPRQPPAAKAERWKIPTRLWPALVSSGNGGYFVVVAETEKTFPRCHGEGQDCFDLVVIAPVRQVHPAANQCKAACVIDCGARSVLHKGARNRVHLVKPGQPKAFLGGKCVSCETGAQCGQCCKICSAPKPMGLFEWSWTDGERGR